MFFRQDSIIYIRRFEKTGTNDTLVINTLEGSYEGQAY